MARIVNFTDSNQKIEHFRFADGTVMSAGDLLNYVFTEGDDTVTFHDDNAHHIYAKAGNDRVVFGNGTDYAEGAAGDDTLVTSGGNDTLVGGLGNDTLEGGSGNDTYIYTAGDGSDTVMDSGGYGVASASSTWTRVSRMSSTT